MEKSVAIIPARGGSTRLKNKNIYPINGKPLIDYTIEAVLASGCFTSVYVSTDSDEIAECALKHENVKVYQRPAKYATERITVLEAIVAMMDEIDKHDVLAYFLPTCPFRNQNDIREGMKLLTPDVDSVVSICQYDEPIQLAMKKVNDSVIPVFDNLIVGATNSKFIQKHYRPNGGYYISWWDKLKINKNFFVGNVKGYEIPVERSVDIDLLSDIHYAEAILNNI